MAKILIQNRFVWDDKAPLGYFLSTCVDLFGGLSYNIFEGGVLLLLISMCQHHEAFRKMFHHQISKLDHPLENTDQKIILSKLVRFHVTVKE